LAVILQQEYGLSQDTTLLPVRNLRLAIHVFQDDAGNGNFHKDSIDQQKFLLQLVEWVNHRLANLDTLKPSASSPYVADSRVRIRLDKILYHWDTYAWDCSGEIDAPYMREQYVDGDSSLSYLDKYQTLPVFIGANNPVVGGHSRNIGDRGYIAIRGYYEAFLRETFEKAIDECGRNLVHELGHCLGLSHNFSGGPGGDQCDNCEDNGCPLEGTSNNIMDYWPSYGYALSKCQFNQIHFYLRGGRGNISEVVINDSCYRVSGPRLQGNDQGGYEVSGEEIIGTGDTVYMHQDLLVKKGGVVKVNGYLSMPGETKIQVEPGGQLEINGGTIGNLCGDLWLGIRVAEGADTLPAGVYLKNGGTIENARTGFEASGNVEAVLFGGIFRNCIESVVFLSGASDSLTIRNCKFLITNRLNHYEEGITPGDLVRTESVQRLEISGSRFVNEPGTLIFDADWMGTGVSTSDPSMEIRDCEFRNLTSGVDVDNQNSDSKAIITANRFINNRYGIRSGSSGVQLISDNRFELQRFNLGSTLGLAISKPGRLVVNGNVFESEYGGGSMTGIYFENAGDENSPVFDNRFSNLPAAIFMNGIPDIEKGLSDWANGLVPFENLKLGPQFRNNQFDRIDKVLAIMVDSAFGTACGTATNLPVESLIPATQWATGGFAWYSAQLPLMAFNGWNPVIGNRPDDGLYFFMNYLGISDPGSGTLTFAGRDSLRKYLRDFIALEDSSALFPGHNVYEALIRISDVPAALRSAKIARSWSGLHAEDQLWLLDALSSVAGRFTKQDSLLTVLGTELARANADRWSSFIPFVVPDSSVRIDHAWMKQLPDLTAFRFERAPQQQDAHPGFRVYPNPAVDYILVQPETGYSFQDGWNVNIHSSDGRYVNRFRIESWDDQKLSVSMLPDGIYFIEIFSGNQYLGTAKFVKSTPK
jgi:hypothetical protein